MKNVLFSAGRKIFVLLSLHCSVLLAVAADSYPTHWWVGMKNQNLQLIIHDKNVATKIPMYKLPAAGMKLADGVTLKMVHRTENPNYVFLDLVIAANTKPGKRNFVFGSGEKAYTITYELKAKSNQNGKTRVQGVTAKDFVYLLMPDRFSNGDTSNDFFTGKRDPGHDRANPFDRHGGDLKGVENHLGYFTELGVTALWMTPVVENDMSRTQEGGTSRSTYHGYAFTDHYKIDQRLGGNEAYKSLITAAHAKGIRIIQDAVYNHVGNDHWSVRDLPMKDWLNEWPAYTNTSYKDQPLVDPYAAAIDKRTSVEGWFTPFLADLNQKNPYVSNFLIQHAIWSTEEFGVDGWRVDTYFYSDPFFLNKINDALRKEFPTITVFGEAWVQSVTNSAYFCENNMNLPFKHNCQGVTDFPFYFAALDLLNQPYGWNEGANKFYQVLAQDVLYKDPMRNCIFLGNHDLDRIYSLVGEDLAKFKMSINLLLTQRGIPQFYYGDEILMKNFKDPTDAEVRKDFPGGWPGDAENKFSSAGRTGKENAVFNHVKALAQFRKRSSAIGSGKLMQYLPKDGLYIYFRYDTKQTIMVMMNTGDKPVKPDWNHYQERTAGFTTIRNVITGERQNISSLTELQPKESFVFELLR
jgi:glycosidase